MDDRELAEQLKKTGNLMDLLNDTDWLKRNAADKAGYTSYVEAGVGLQSYVDQLKQVSPEAFRTQKQQVTALSILLPALHDWLNSWELGLSFEAVYSAAQRLVYEHLVQAIEMQSDWVEALIGAHHQKPSVQARERIASLLSQEDWQVIAKVAAQDMEKRILAQAQVQSEVAISV